MPSMEKFYVDTAPLQAEFGRYARAFQQDGGLARATEAGARVFKDAWQLHVPPHVLTGEYLLNIHLYPTEVQGTTARTRVGVDGQQVPQERFLEYGTRHQPATPIARPAWDESQEEQKAAMERSARATLRAVKKR